MLVALVRLPTVHYTACALMYGTRMNASARKVMLVQTVYRPVTCGSASMALSARCPKLLSLATPAHVLISTMATTVRRSLRNALMIGGGIRSVDPASAMRKWDLNQPVTRLPVNATVQSIHTGLLTVIPASRVTAMR